MATRRYDSTNRRARAQRTRDRILDAAVELHGRGVMAFEALAEAAGVPLPTVRKHFPNREQLFAGCTGHFFATFAPPALDRAAAIADPQARLELVTAELCRAHEATHHLVWHSAPLCDESPALAAALDGLHAFVDRGARLVVDACCRGAARARRQTVSKRARALLDPLTYRAFRVRAGLSAGAARRELTALLGCAVGTTSPESTSPP